MHKTPTRWHPRRLAGAAMAAWLCAAGLSLANAAPAQGTPTPSLAEQMRALLGKPAAAGALAPGGSNAAAAVPARGVGPLVADGPAQLRQSAAELAQRFPAAQRGAMSKAFEESFAFWQKLETQLGLAPNDLAAGVAAFIAGNYAVFMQQEVSDEQFKTLVRQMQGLLGQTAGIRQAGPAQRRAMYEQMAMVGTFMIAYREQLKRQPNPTEELNFRNSAKANLEAALGVGVERMLIGTQGLELR